MNVAFPRFQDWMARGFIKPSVESEGQGKPGLFDREDLYGIHLFQEMLSMGFNRKIASEFLLSISKTLHEPPEPEPIKPEKPLHKISKFFARKAPEPITTQESNKPEEWATFVRFARRDAKGIVTDYDIDWWLADGVSDLEDLEQDKKRMAAEIKAIHEINIGLIKEDVDARLKELGYET